MSDEQNPDTTSSSWPELDPRSPEVQPLITKSMGRFFPASGDMEERNQALYEWVRKRQATGLWPYGLRTQAAPGCEARVEHPSGVILEGINFTTVDYLGLAQHEGLREVAVEAAREHGFHTPSSGPLMGNSVESRRLQAELADFLDRPTAFVCPTGWAAAFAAVSGVVRKRDHVVMDELAHNCLQQAAYGSTPNVQTFRHLDNDHLEERLSAIRAEDAENAILVATEGLYSMDGDIPDLAEMVEICRRHDALVLVDVAHDLGSLGPSGTGSIGAQGLLDEVDIIAGSFSKAFGTNGGFISSKSPAVEWAQLCFGGPYTYSTAMSPVQVAVAQAAPDIVRGDEGDALRRDLMDNVRYMREGATERGLELFGQPSPIVPIYIGREPNSRLAGRISFEKGLIATCLEFPVVQRGAARYRFSMSPLYTRDQMDRALDIAAEAVEEARLALEGEPAVSG